MGLGEGNICARTLSGWETVQTPGVPVACWTVTWVLLLQGRPAGEPTSCGQAEAHPWHIPPPSQEADASGGKGCPGILVMG